MVGPLALPRATYMEERIANQIAKDAGVLGLPVGDNVRLLRAHILLGPGKVTKELNQLILGAEITAQKLASAQGEGQRGYQQGQKAGIYEATVKKRLGIQLIVHDITYIQKTFCLIE